MARKKKNSFNIPGVSFSWKRALGITQAKQKFARKTGIPTSKAGLQRKVGKMAMGGCATQLLIIGLCITAIIMILF
jgi:hypothetical protein